MLFLLVRNFIERNGVSGTAWENEIERLISSTGSDHFV